MFNDLLDIERERAQKELEQKLELLKNRRKQRKINWAKY
jgi:hypothetical protein